MDGFTAQGPGWTVSNEGLTAVQSYSQIPKQKSDSERKVLDGFKGNRYQVDRELDARYGNGLTITMQLLLFPYEGMSAI